MIESVELTYRYSKAKFAKMTEKCDKAVSKITADLKSNSSLSDAEKVLLVHDRLASLCAYDYANYVDCAKGLIDELPPEDFSAYGPLVRGTGVCDGYSSAMTLCLEKLGIKNYIVDSYALNHAWNMVYLNGKPYFVDTTWDDPVWDVSGRAEHDNLLVSTSKLKEDHKANDYPTDPVSTLYDNAYWTCSETAFQLIGDYLYYIDNENETLCRRNHNGTSTVLKTLDYTWYSRPDESGWWVGHFSRLASYDGRLVYSTPTKVYAYDISTGKTSVLYSPRLDTSNCYYIYGMTIKDDTLYLDVNNSPQFERNTKAKNQIKTSLSHKHVKKNVAEIPKTYCTDTGYTAGTICKECGKVFSGRTKIAPTEHVWGKKELSVKATMTKNGKYVCKCANCPAKKTIAIPKASKISLSKTSFVYDGKVKTPSVIVKDSKGNNLSAKSYTVTMSNNASKEPGTYTVTVKLKGKYSGSKQLTYRITSAETDTLAKVKNLKQTKVTTTAVSIKWSAVTGAAYYQIQCSKDNGKTWKAVLVVSGTSAVVKSLKPGVEYRFRVRALDSTKTSAGKVSAVLKTQTLCAAPEITKLESTKSGTVNISWKEVTGASTYTIAWSDDAENWFDVGNITFSNVEFSGFDSGRRAYLKISAVNAYGNSGAYSAVKSVTVQ